MFLGLARLLSGGSRALQLHGLIRQYLLGPAGLDRAELITILTGLLFFIEVLAVVEIGRGFGGLRLFLFRRRLFLG
jgi:hypothetical protein